MLGPLECATRSYWPLGCILTVRLGDRRHLKSCRSIAALSPPPPALQAAAPDRKPSSRGGPVRVYEPLPCGTYWDDSYASMLKGGSRPRSPRSGLAVDLGTQAEVRGCPDEEGKQRCGYLSAECRRQTRDTGRADAGLRRWMLSAGPWPGRWLSPTRRCPLA